MRMLTIFIGMLAFIGVCALIGGLLGQYFNSMTVAYVVTYGLITLSALAAGWLLEH